MTNINSDPFQQEFSNTNSTMASSEQTISDSAQITQENDSNKLWLALLIIFAIIVGFWIGFFVNQYFYQVPINEPNSPNSFDDLETSNQERVVINGYPYIVFQEQDYGVGETISLPSGNECLKNLNLVIEDIQEDIIAFQIEEFDPTLYENSDEAGDGLIWGDFKDPICFPIRSSCEDTLFEYCFYVTHTDEFYYLNYDLGEQRSSESLIRALEP